MENGFEQALVLFRGGDDRAAHQAARALLEQAPGHVGGMMLLLATAGGCGDERAINEALLDVADYYGRMLAIPEVLELFQTGLLAPVVRSHTFRTMFAAGLRLANHRTREGADRELAGRLMQEAARDAAIEAALAAAPICEAAPAFAGEVIHLVDLSTGDTVANLRGAGPHLLGRNPKAGVRLDDPYVSREHLELCRRDGIWSAQSLSPTNAPLLNGRAMSLMPAALHHGDELRLGNVVLGVFAGPGERVERAPERKDSASAASRTQLQPPTRIPPPVQADRPGPEQKPTLEWEKGGLDEALQQALRPRA